MRDLKLDEIPDLALGVGVLGGGGGGDPYLGQLLAQALIRETGPVQLWDVDEVPADALVVASAYMGAPMVMAEKLPQGDKAALAVRILERYLGSPIGALVPDEIVQDLAFNFLVVDRDRVIAPAGTPAFHRLLGELGIEIAGTVPVSEYVKAAGGIACATGILAREPVGRPESEES